jgi:membrane protein implicated in regulation of membrane protease activity
VRSARHATDQPDLNRRPEQLVGRVLVVEEAIDSGRGKVRAGDTLWPVQGPDAPPGAEVRVTAAHGTVLQVERV